MQHPWQCEAQTPLGARLLAQGASCAGLAVVKYKLGHWKEVQDLFARAYDIQSTHLEPDHADLAATMSHSAGLLKAMSKLGDAEIVYRTVRPPAPPSPLIYPPTQAPHGLTFGPQTGSDCCGCLGACAVLAGGWMILGHRTAVREWHMQCNAPRTPIWRGQPGELWHARP